MSGGDSLLPLESHADRPPATTRRGAALWGRGFRPFFLLAGLHGCCFLPVWLLVLHGWMAAPAWLGAAWWHAHEMLFGFVGAAVAGFLLTSVPVWTQSRPLSGAPLAGLVALWLMGRAAMLLPGRLSPELVAPLDLAFLPVVALVIGRPILASRQLRNTGFVAVLLGLFAANLVIHLQAAGWTETGAGGALRVSVDLVILLVVIVSGRITPLFTRNALRRVGSSAEVRSRPRLDRLAVAAVLLFALADGMAPHSAASGLAALLAAVAVAGRMAGWKSLRTRRDPLVWSLHVGHAWVVIGLACIALADLTAAIPPTVGLHALTVGAMGATILAVMTRVGLGHTGRPFMAPRGAAIAYVLVSLAAVARCLGPAAGPSLLLPLLTVSGLLWSASFGLFTWVYAPILTGPRVDGAPG